ncbi:MAG: hypothetical protein MUF42_03130 [Cytophagaceae bacterium]|jgi:hypothetical protein|nr:hypothetical protein [Cytophagaceae bacterium]
MIFSILISCFLLGWNSITSSLHAASNHAYAQQAQNDSIENVISSLKIAPKLVEEKMDDYLIVRKGYFHNNELIKMEIELTYKKDLTKEIYYFKNKQLFSAHITTSFQISNHQKEVSEKLYYFKKERIFKAIKRTVVLNGHHPKTGIESIPFAEEVENLDMLNREIHEKVTAYAEVLSKK